MNKIRILLLLAGFFPFLAGAQSNACQWNFEAKKTGELTYDILLKAKTKENWHIYSQYTPTGGPVATLIEFDPQPMIVLDGAIAEEGNLKTPFEEVFGIQVKYYEGEVVFRQKIRLKKPVKTSLNGRVTFMLCNDKECLPPQTLNFKIKIG